VQRNLEKVVSIQLLSEAKAAGMTNTEDIREYAASHTPGRLEELLHPAKGATGAVGGSPSAVAKATPGPVSLTRYGVAAEGHPDALGASHGAGKPRGLSPGTAGPTGAASVGKGRPAGLGSGKVRLSGSGTPPPPLSTHALPSPPDPKHWRELFADAPLGASLGPGAPLWHDPGMDGTRPSSPPQGGAPDEVEAQSGDLLDSLLEGVAAAVSTDHSAALEVRPACNVLPCF
jgi:hypothetical protein